MPDVDVQQLNQSLNAAASAAKALAMEHSNLAASLRQQTGQAASAVNDLSKASKNTNAQLSKTAELQKKVAESIKKETELRDELNELTERANKLQAEGNHETEEYHAILARIRDTSGKVDAASKDSAKSLHALNTHQLSMGKTAKIADAALVLFGSTLSKSIDQLKAQYQATGGVVEGSGNLFTNMMEQQWQALARGMTGAEFQKIISSQRQTVNAMGGTEQALKDLDPAINRFRILTGDNAKALELAAASAHDFASKGIRPTSAAINAYTNDMTKLTKLTGMSTDQARDYYDNIAQESDSIHLLRAAREDERGAILQSQRALVQQSIAAGMSAEQAKEAAKMLNKMVAAKPLDRLKQAAKIRALGAAMGVAGSEEAAQAIIAGPRATAEQKQQLQQFNQTMTNAVDKMTGQGLGSEIFATALTDKMGLEEQYGRNSPFSTTLGDTMKPTAEALNKLSDVSTHKMGEVVDILTRIQGMMSVLTAGAFLPVAIGAGIIGIAPKLASILGSVLGGGLGGLGGLKGAEAAAGAAGTAGRMGKLLAVGKNIIGKGGLGAVASMAGEYGGGALEEAGYTKTGAGVKVLGSAGTGAALGSMLGPIGTLLGGALGAGYGLYQNWDALTGTAPANKKAPANAPEAGMGAEAALATTSDGITKQLEQMKTSNDLLQQIADMSNKQIDLAEKQLVALTMSDKEKADMNVRANLRRDSKFGAQYGYV